MFENVDIEEAVRRSMQTEKNAMDFYRRGAELMKNAEAKKVFQLLAREEREHAQWFFEVYPGDKIVDFEAFINAEPQADADWVTDLNAIRYGDFNERKAMELALEKEKQLAEHLRQMAARIEEPKVRKVFEENARSTEHHYQLIESEYARLMGMVHETDIDTFVRE